MPELTLCMPSRRNLRDSHAAIESAVAFCEARDALLVVSDNSGDDEKRAFWEGKSPCLIYHISDAETAIGNMMFAVQASNTPFIMPIGDDDMIVADEGVEPFDLSDIGFDYVGVFPVTESFQQREKAGSISVLSLEQDDPSLRLRAYLEEKVPNNGGFYSIFRRELWLATMDLFWRFHPTRASFSDWMISLSMFTAGKMAHDPSVRYRYNLSKWGTKDLIIEERKKLFRDVGLPEKAMNYERLFQFLDFFVLINRVGSPLSIDERQNLSRDAVQLIFAKFIIEVANAPELFEDGIGAIAEMALEEQEVFAQFQLGLLMVERVQAGLKDKYIAFIQAAVTGA